jgi:hypothetical protein
MKRFALVLGMVLLGCGGSTDVDEAEQDAGIDVVDETQADAELEAAPDAEQEAEAGEPDVAADVIEASVVDCGPVCDRIFACSPAAPLSACLDWCALQSSKGICSAEWVAYTDCIAASTTCDECLELGNAYSACSA